MLAASYLGIAEDGVNWAFIRAALASVANLALVPAQDVLGLDSNARMNVPSETVGSWAWRLRAGALTKELAEKMAQLVEITDRDSCVKEPSSQSEQSDGKVGEDFAA